MSLRIRQIVLAARDLDSTVAQVKAMLGVEVCYRDPEVCKFGLHNALFPIGHTGFVQFLEVVAPIAENTAAGRHLDRHGDSAYMLILQSDDLARDRARLNRLGVRIVWESTHSDIAAVHLHPKDIGAAIVSLDQPTPPESWRWAGPAWGTQVRTSGAQRVTATTIAARDPPALAHRWAQVLGTEPPKFASGAWRIGIEAGELRFVSGPADIIEGFDIDMANATASTPRTDAVAICGARFRLRL